MRLLLISNLFAPENIGGYELVAHELAERLTAAGHDVAVATSPLVNHSGEAAETTVTVHRVLSYTGLSADRLHPGDEAFRSGIIQLSNIAALRVLIDTFQPDQILLCNISGLGALGIVTFLHDVGFSPAIYLGDNVFDHACGDTGLRDSFFRLFGASKALRALRPLAVSQTVVDEIELGLGISLASPLFVPGWVPDSLTPLQPRPAEGPHRFVYSSRLASHKGLWILLDAAKHLLACGDDAFQIDVYGAGQVPEFIQRVHAEGLDAHIRYGGMLRRGAMIEAFRDYDALLFPTWQREPLGLVPFEAAAQGCIPIMTAQIGAAEWFTATDCIKIDRSPTSLAGAMQSLMAMPLEECERLRQTTAANVRRRFGAGRWINLIDQSLSQLPPRRRTVTAQRVQNAMFSTTRIWRD